MIKSLVDVFNREGLSVSTYSFSLSDQIMDESKIVLGDYLYKMNVIMHFSDDEIDLFDNPYFEVKPYIIDDNINYFGRPPSNDSEL